MNELLDDGIYIVTRNSYSNAFIAQWIRLFQRCFGGTEENATRVFQKYLLNDSRICYTVKDGTMVAAYCGLKLSHEDSAIFLSTDTMSDGTQKGSSVILGKRLYKSFLEEDIYVVCGYPNKNIRRIREKGLGWTLDGNLYLYVGVPFLWRFFRKPIHQNGLWKLVRPTGGWFTRKNHFWSTYSAVMGCTLPTPGLPSPCPLTDLAYFLSRCQISFSSREALATNALPNRRKK